MEFTNDKVIFNMDFDNMLTSDPGPAKFKKITVTKFNWNGDKTSEKTIWVKR